MNRTAFFETASETLRARGLRMTSQRKVILEALERADEHLDAETLYERVRKRDQAVGLATVYRTLNVLVKAGLIQQRFLDQDRSRGYYEVDRAEHYHFTCHRCGKVIEFQTGLMGQIRAQLGEQYGVQIGHTYLHFEGLCAECAASADVD
jgi:Fe2+ or Zn2+ uptake regulation protein